MSRRFDKSFTMMPELPVKWWNLKMLLIVLIFVQCHNLQCIEFRLYNRNVWMRDLYRWLSIRPSKSNGRLSCCNKWIIISTCSNKDDIQVSSQLQVFAFDEKLMDRHHSTGEKVNDHLWCCSKFCCSVWNQWRSFTKSNLEQTCCWWLDSFSMKFSNQSLWSF